MKLRIIQYAILLVTATLFNSCKQEGCTDPNATNFDVHANAECGCCQYNGTVSFWSGYSPGESEVLVYDGHSTRGTITATFTSAPACGATGCFTYLLPPGTYTYDIFINSSFTGSGSFTVTSNGCTVVHVI